MTVSESNVAAFFGNQGFLVCRIPEATEERPDYWIVRNSFRAAVEVKEISESDLEKAVRREVETHGQCDSYDSRDDSKTLRRLISKSNDQLKKLCINGEPGILVVQDVRPFWTKNLWMEEALKQAMFGDFVIWRSAPHPSIMLPTKTTEVQFGRNRSNTGSKNRSVSAVGILHHDSDLGDTTLSLYHNPFAHHRLNLPLASAGKIREFVINTVTQYGQFIENDE